MKEQKFKLPETMKELIAWAQTAMGEKAFAEALQRWQVVRDKFPETAQGWIQAGYAALALKDFALAERLAAQAVEKFPNAANAFILQAQTAMGEKAFAEALQRWQVVRDKFPETPPGWIQAGHAALALKDFALAERLAAQAVEKFPNAANAFILQAQIAMGEKAFVEALQRWQVVRDKFPETAQGWIQAGYAALALKDFALAERLAAQAVEKFPETVNAHILRTQVAISQKNFYQTQMQSKLASTVPADILGIAEASMRMGLFKQALVCFKLVMKKGPMVAQGYIGGARAAMKLKKYSYAQKLAEEAIELFPANLAAYQQLIQALKAQKDFERALLILNDLSKKFPLSIYPYSERSTIEMELKDYESADNTMKEAIERFPDNLNLFLHWAQLPLLAKDPALFKEAFERAMLVSHKFKSSFQAHLHAITACLRIIKTDYDFKTNNMYKDTYYLLVKSFLQHFSDPNKDHNGGKNLAVYADSIDRLKFVLPVIKSINCDLIDIVIDKKMEEDTSCITEFGLHSYNIIYGKVFCENYRYVFLDHLRILDLKDIKLKCKFIGFIHATDNMITPLFLEGLSLAILSARNQMQKGLIPYEPFPEEYTLNSKGDYQCEICYTGPYHIGEFFEKRHWPKEDLKAELAKELKVEIPKEKPLIAVFEDEISHRGQIAYALNRMSRFATVIYKTFLNPTNSIFKKLNSNIYILRGPLAPNLLRFSADYIFCGYLSGTFTTSVMFGLNVLAYYSRIVSHHNKLNLHDAIFYYDFLADPDPQFMPAKHILYNKFYKAKRFFDLLDTKSIKNAILGTEYISWYREHLSEFQKEAFGDYMLDESPQKTAEYILRFANEGTLGRDCSAVYLKEQYFK